MEQDLVSIITPLYNGAEHVAETIETVINQTYPLWEMVIIDDCSTDQGQGKNIVREYIARDSRISLIALEKNAGSSGARNRGIHAARGEYIAFLDADDLWNNDFLEKQLAFIQKTGAMIVFSSYRRIDEHSGDELLAPFIVPERVNYHDILKSLPICPSTAMMHTGRLGKYYFNENMGSLRDDYVYWLYLLRKHVAYAYGNPEVLAAYRMRQDSVTAKKSRMIIPHWKVLHRIENLSLAKSAYYTLWWAWISFWKYKK